MANIPAFVVEFTCMPDAVLYIRGLVRPAGRPSTLCRDQQSVPVGLSAGRRLLVVRFDVHANRGHKRGFKQAPFPPKSGRHLGKPSRVLIVSAGNSHASPVCELDTGAGKVTGTAFIRASTSITSAAGAGMCGSWRK